MAIIGKYACIKQHDTTDCGAACLATVAAHHGLTLSIAQVRALAGTDQEGTNAYGLISAAKELKFDAKAVTAEEKEDIFSEFPLPAIAHVLVEDEAFHYVVIHKITKKKITAADPAKGLVDYTIDEFFKIWSGVLIFCEPREDFERGNRTKSIFKRFFIQLIPQKKMIAGIIAMSILYTGIGIGTTFFYQHLMDEVLPSGLLGMLGAIALVVISMYVFQSIWSFIRDYFILKFGQKLDFELIFGYCKHVVKLPLSFFGTRKIGEIIARFQDASNIRDLLSTAALTALIDTLMAIGGGIILFIISPPLFAVTLIISVLYAIIVFSFNRARRKIARAELQANEQLSSYMIESLNGIETVKSHGAEDVVLEETEGRFKKFLKLSFKGGIIGSLSGSLSGMIGSVGGIVIMWVGVMAVMTDDFTIGTLFTFSALTGYFLGPIQSLIHLQSTFQFAKVASDRLGEMLDLTPEVLPDECEKSAPSLYGDIEINNIDFRYGMRDLILHDVSMSIKAGEKIALVGESGSGKTTLAKLLIKFYTAEKGSITIGGHDIKDINLEHVRRKVSYIAQDIFLFSGTILENLQLGNRGVTEEQAIEACKRASAHDFIDALPLKYKTKLEENGGNLSVGQRQRLVIARALLSNPEILIMDEATSNLDSVTEKAISAQINNNTDKLTTFIIAHRLSTIMACDRIYVMDKGRIAECGSHNELMNAKGIYYDLWKGQIPEVTPEMLAEILPQYSQFSSEFNPGFAPVPMQINGALNRFEETNNGFSDEGFSDDEFISFGDEKSCEITNQINNNATEFSKDNLVENVAEPVDDEQGEIADIVGDDEIENDDVEQEQNDGIVGIISGDSDGFADFESENKNDLSDEFYGDFNNYNDDVQDNSSENFFGFADDTQESNVHEKSENLIGFADDVNDGSADDDLNVTENIDNDEHFVPAVPQSATGVPHATNNIAPREYFAPPQIVPEPIIPATTPNQFANVTPPIDIESEEIEPEFIAPEISEPQAVKPIPFAVVPVGVAPSMDDEIEENDIFETENEPAEVTSFEDEFDLISLSADEPTEISHEKIEIEPIAPEVFEPQLSVPIEIESSEHEAEPETVQPTSNIAPVEPSVPAPVLVTPLSPTPVQATPNQPVYRPKVYKRVRRAAPKKVSPLQNIKKKVERKISKKLIELMQMRHDD